MALKPFRIKRHLPLKRPLPMPQSSQNDAVLWHALKTSEVLERVQSTPEGLSSREADKRLQEYGRNELPPPKRQHPVMRFLLQFNNALIYFMLSAAVIAFFLDHAVDSAVILAVAVSYTHLTLPTSDLV